MVELREATLEDIENEIENDNDYIDEEDFQSDLEHQETAKTQQIEYEEDEDDFSLDESLLERLSALVDIVPPTVRANVASFAINLKNYSIKGSGLVGSALWAITTASLLVVLPISLELERDSMAIQQQAAGGAE
jgi:import receptor subunit TOM22